MIRKLAHDYIIKERIVEFLEEFVFNKYKNNIIILDNDSSYRNNYVKYTITEAKIIIYFISSIYINQRYKIVI